MKLSKAQQHIIDKMNEGYELCMSHSFGVSCWLQRGELWNGGESENASQSSVTVLFDKGLIEQKGREHGIMIFKLVNS